MTPRNSGSERTPIKEININTTQVASNKTAYMTSASFVRNNFAMKSSNYRDANQITGL